MSAPSGSIGVLAPEGEPPRPCAECGILIRQFFDRYVVISTKDQLCIRCGRREIERMGLRFVLGRGHRPSNSPERSPVRVEGGRP
jgi:hypothetical protein